MTPRFCLDVKCKIYIEERMLRSKSLEFDWLLGNGKPTRFLELYIGNISYK